MKKFLIFVSSLFLFAGCNNDSTEAGYRLRNGSSKEVVYNTSKNLAAGECINLPALPKLKLDKTQESKETEWYYKGGDGYRCIDVKDTAKNTFKITVEYSKAFSYYDGTKKVDVPEPASPSETITIDIPDSDFLYGDWEFVSSEKDSEDIASGTKKIVFFGKPALFNVVSKDDVTKYNETIRDYSHSYSWNCFVKY